MFTVLNSHCNIKLAPSIAPPNLSDHGDTTLFIVLMYIILLGFSQTFLELSANVEVDVCPGVVAIYNCTTNNTYVEWTAEPYFSQFQVAQLNLGRIESRGPIFVLPISHDPFTSKLIINSDEVLNSTQVICSAGNNSVMSLAFRRKLGKYRFVTLNNMNVISLLLSFFYLIVAHMLTPNSCPSLCSVG